MARETFTYSNEKVTVVWKPKLCIHSAICFKGLPEVFNPKVRPWVNSNGATSERIIEQVRQCPSGALSIELIEEPTPLNTKSGTDNQPQQTTIQVVQNGPALIKGNCLVQTPDGKEELRENVVALCRCGTSNNKPYCDGSHTRTGFQG